MTIITLWLNIGDDITGLWHYMNLLFDLNPNQLGFCVFENLCFGRKVVQTGNLVEVPWEVLRRIS